MASYYTSQLGKKYVEGKKDLMLEVIFQGHQDYMILANAINIGTCGTSVISCTLGTLHV